VNRRQFLATSGATALSAATASPALAQAGSADARLRAMLDGFFYERLADSPEQATRLGLDTGERAALRGKLSDTSAAGVARDLARSKAQARQLATIDRNSLSDTSKLDYDVVTYQLDRAIGGERFGYGETAGRYAPYVLSQLTGSYREIPDFLDSQHRVANAADADAYLARLEAFPAALDGELARQKEDAAKGVFAPDYILDTTLKMQASLRDQPAAQTVLVASFVKKLAAAGLPPERAAQAEKIVTDKIFPALDRQRALVQDLRAKATHDAGVWRLPEGEAFYAAAAEAATTTALTGDEIHQIGLDQVAPARLHEGGLAGQPGLLLGGDVVAAAGRFVVVQHGMRRPHVAVSRRADAQAQVDIVEGDGKTLVEPPHVVEHGLAHHEAGGGDRRQFLRQPQAPHLPGGSARLADVGMAGHAVEPQDDAGVLDAVVRVQQHCAHRAHAGANGLRHHLLQPPG